MRRITHLRTHLLAGLALVAALSDPTLAANGRALLRGPLALLTTWGTAAPSLEVLVRAGSGEDALPPVVRDMVTLARARGLETYSLSPRLARDELILQRVTEGAWPIRRRRGAADQFWFVDEPPFPGCRVVESRGLVAYVACE